MEKNVQIPFSVFFDLYLLIREYDPSILSEDLQRRHRRVKAEILNKAEKIRTRQAYKDYLASDPENKEAALQDYLFTKKGGWRQ